MVKVCQTAVGKKVKYNQAQRKTGLHPLKSSFCMTNFSMSVRNITVLQPQLTWMKLLREQKNTVTSLAPTAWTHCSYAHTTSRFLPDLWHQPRLAKVTCGWNWRPCGITPAISVRMCLIIKVCNITRTCWQCSCSPSWPWNCCLWYGRNRQSLDQIQFTSSVAN